MSGAASTTDKSSEAPALAASGGALLVEANGRTFAISAADVHSIVRVGSVAETPGGPEFLIGFTSVKGAILPVPIARAAYRSQGPPRRGVAVRGRA